jgi:hypothetical protein
VQRRLVALLFLGIGISLAALAVFAATSGGRALIVAVAAAGLAAWMGDLARKAWPKRGRPGKKV